MGIMDEIKEDAMGDFLEAFMESDKGKEYMAMAQKFIKPAMFNLLKQLGQDEKRFMLYYDADSKQIVFLTLKTENIKQFEVELEDPKKDIFTIDPKKVKEGKIEELVQMVAKKIGGGFV